MRIYKRMEELREDYIKLPKELVQEMLYDLLILETEYPDIDAAQVLLLEGAAELDAIYRLFPYLQNLVAEVDETVRCKDNTSYRKIVWIISDDGIGLVAFIRNGI